MASTILVEKLTDAQDALVLIAPFPSTVDIIENFDAIYAHAKAVDNSVGSDCVLIACAAAPGGRLILSPTGPLNRDYDDVRRYADAAKAGFDRAIKAGSKNPAFYIVSPPTPSEDYSRFQEVSALSALAASFLPIEYREFSGKVSRAESLSFFKTPTFNEQTLQHIAAIEAGRGVARDIGGSDPERMTSIKICEYLTTLFADSSVSMRVEGDIAELKSSYPLLAAVARCANVVERHQARVVHLEYVGKGEVTSTLFLVGKGITYDTGGADVKAGGHMAGMHRDKCGAAAVCGLFATLARLQPPGLRVVGKLALVRNSIGADAYVADEILVSRSGVRVRVGNTDAEGRMVLSDLLCLAKEEALSAVAPKLFTIATLTGHVVRAYGDGYSATMDNGPARKQGISKKLFDNGAAWGDPFEISTVRREDFNFIASSYITEDVVQCNSAPSSVTARGHQFPAAFIAVASGVDKHGLDSTAPLPYSHLDIAGSTKDWPEPVSAAPLPALFASFVLPHLL